MTPSNATAATATGIATTAMAIRTAAAPTGAAIIGYNGGGRQQAVFQLSRDLDRIDARIERSVQRGNLSRREAFGLRRDAQQVRWQLRRSQRDGIRGRELGQLRYQVAQLEQRLRHERNDRDGRRF